MSVSGIAFSVLLILILEGFAAGLYQQATAFINNSGADLIVAQAGVDNMQTARSVLPLFIGDEITAFPGVERVAGVLAAPVMFERGERKTPIMLIGYKTGQRLGAPWNLARGRLPKKSGEVVFDLALALTNGLKLGDEPELLGRKFKIVGLSNETQSFMNPYVFISRSDARALLRAGPTVSYFFVKVERPSFAPHIKTQLEAAARTTDISTRARMAANDRTILEDIMSDPINLMVGIAYVVGLLVIGLTIYTAMLEKLAEFGTMKAVGAGRFRLYLIVCRQSLLTVILGFLPGVALAFLAGIAIESLFPRFDILLTEWVLVRTFLGAAAMGLAAAFLPARLIANLEPAVVFD